MAIRADPKRMEYLDGELPLLSRICTYCRHFRKGQGRTCAAFPQRDSIPDQIWLGENNHQEPYPGDHGIQFEPVDTPFLRQKFPQYFEEPKKGEAA